MSKKAPSKSGTSLQLSGRHQAITLQTDAAGNVVSVQIRGADLPPPERSMAADWVQATHHGTTVRFAFGQTRLDGSGLIAALAVHVPYQRVVDTLASPGNTFLESLHKYRNALNLQIPDLKFSGDNWMTDRMVVERAAIMSIAFVAEDADMRFYRISAGDFQALKQGRTPELVYPVVEVTMGIDLLCALTDQLEAILSKVSAGAT